MKVVIAGASGFVGKHLIGRLLQDPDIHVRALARSLPNHAHDRLETQSCDLFSLSAVENALEGQDEAIYLVHSMLPSSQLSQGNFADYDLILADNFARAAKKHNIRRIIYLGGIIPRGMDHHPDELSQHLRSRLEVEEVFKSYGIPVLALRAGMVMGKEGSSFQMLFRLVQRLPVMICPAWTYTHSSPIHVRDVTESFYYALTQPSLRGTYDLASAQSLSYVDMFEKCARKLHKKRLFLNVPFFSPQLSKYWVRLVTGAPKNLVYPLVESLLHDMSPGPEQTLRIPNWKYTTFDEALSEVTDTPNVTLDNLAQPKAYTNSFPAEHLGIVQSVQRHDMNIYHNADWVSQEYVKWLNAHFRGLVLAQTEGDITRFTVAGLKLVLMELTLSRERSYDNRILFYVTGGILAHETKRGRLEFRVMPDGKHLITAIHDYRPSLPWYLYKYTQALLHASVMKRFGRALSHERKAS